SRPTCLPISTTSSSVSICEAPLPRLFWISAARRTIRSRSSDATWRRPGPAFWSVDWRLAFRLSIFGGVAAGACEAAVSPVVRSFVITFPLLIVTAIARVACFPKSYEDQQDACHLRTQRISCPTGRETVLLSVFSPAFWQCSLFSGGICQE